MKRLATPLSILAVAGVAACTTTYHSSPFGSAAVVPQTTGYRPGTGVIQNVFAAPARVAVAGGSATTNRPEPPVGTEGARSGPINRLAIKMDKGGAIQYIDTESNEFGRGMRVELSPDGKIKKL